MPKIFYSWLFYFMLAHFVLLIFLFWANIKYLFREIKKIDKKIWIILLIIFLFGFYLRNSEYWLGPYSDGYVYQESAHLWVQHGEYVKSCALGNQLDCKLFEQVLFLPGYPFIIALIHLTFGINSLNASIISAILSSLTIIIVFFIAYLIFKKPIIGLWSALVYAIIPINILYSQTGLSRPSGLFFLGLAILFYLIAAWLLFITLLSYSIYIRPEIYILIPLFLIFLISFKWSGIKCFFKNILSKKVDFKTMVLIIFSAWLFFVLQMPALNWLIFNNPIGNLPGGGFYGLHMGGIIILGKALFLQLFNLTPSGIIINHYPLLISFLFIFGFVTLIIRNKRAYYFILSLFCLYFFITVLFFDGNIQGTGELTRDYFRRSLMLQIPYSIIAGFGIYLVTFFRKREYKRYIFHLIVLFLIFIVLNIALGLTPARLKLKISGNYNIFKTFFVKSLFEDKRADKIGDSSLIYPKKDYWEIIKKVPNDCLVIAGRGLVVTNDYFKNNKRKMAQTDLIFYTTENLFIQEIKDNKCVAYIEGRQCRSMYARDSLYLCRFLEERLDKELLFKQGFYNIYSVKLK